MAGKNLRTQRGSLPWLSRFTSVFAVDIYAASEIYLNKFQAYEINKDLESIKQNKLPRFYIDFVFLFKYINKSVR